MGGGGQHSIIWGAQTVSSTVSDAPFLALAAGMTVHVVKGALQLLSNRSK